MTKRLCGLILCAAVLLGLVPGFAAVEEDNMYFGLNTEAYQIDMDVLNSHAGVHPRLMMTEEKLKQINRDIQTDSRLRAIYNDVISRAESAYQTTPATQIVGTTGTDSTFSTLANYIPAASLAYRLTGEKRYLEGAEKWINQTCAYPQWENPERPDLATGHTMMALGLAYDWLYDDLSPQTRATLKARMMSEGTHLYQFVNQDARNYWNRSWLQNHMWIAVSGMACVAMALFDEESSVIPWLERANDHFSTTMSMLPSDGVNHEGVDYFFYGMESLFMYTYLSKTVLGADMFQTEFFQNVTDWLLYSFYPRESWNENGYFHTFADCTGTGNVLDQMVYLVANETGDKRAQWLAKELGEAGLTGNHSYLSLLWYDPSFEAEQPKDMPLMRHFDDTDYVISRSGWNNGESMVTFRCGPPMGHKERELTKDLSTYYDWGSGHVHPDVNHFLIFGNGEPILRDDEYSLPKLTSQHNTLNIDGRGQVGEGADWFDGETYHAAGADAQILKVESDGELDYIIGDATQAYTSNLDVKKYQRHMLYLRPDILLVVDDIELDSPHTMELRFFPEYQNIYQQSDGGFLIPGNTSNFKITPLTTDGIEVGMERDELITRYYTQDRNFVSLKKEGDRWVNATALSWSAASDTPKNVSVQRSGNRFVFTVEERQVTLDLNTGEASLSGSLDYDNGEVKASVNGTLLQGEPVLPDAYTMVPAASFFSAANGQSSEDGDVLCASTEEMSFQFTDGSDQAVLNGETVQMPCQAYRQNGTFYIPLRFTAEAIGYRVTWDSNADIARASKPKNTGSGSAKLLNISADGAALPYFDPEQYTYTYNAIGTQKVPSVIAVPEDPNAKVQISRPVSLPGDTVITVTSSDGQQTRTYTISHAFQYHRGTGVLDIVGLSCDDPTNNMLPNLLDGNPETSWTLEGKNRWLKADLGEVKTVAAVAIDFFQGHLRDEYFDVEVSVDDKNWTKVLSATSYERSTATQVFDFPASEARYVKIVGQGNSISGWNNYSAIGFFDDEKYLREAKLSLGAGDILKGTEVTPEITGTMNDGSAFDPSKAEIHYQSDTPDVAAVKDRKIQALEYGIALITAEITYNGYTTTRSQVMRVSDGSISLLAKSDGFTVDWRVNEGYGTGKTVDVRDYALTPGSSRAGWVQFDLSTLEGKPATVKLCLHTTVQSKETMIDTMDVNIYATDNRPWDDNTMIQSSMPGIKRYLGKSTIHEGWTWTEVDVTSQVVNSWNKGKRNVTFAILPGTRDGFFQFHARETGEKYTPYLKVTLEE